MTTNDFMRDPAEDSASIIAQVKEELSLVANTISYEFLGDKEYVIETIDRLETMLRERGFHVVSDINARTVNAMHMPSRTELTVTVNPEKTVEDDWLESQSECFANMAKFETKRSGLEQEE